jgi:hypothetical protein
MALVYDCVDSTGSNEHALAPNIPKHFIYCNGMYKQHCNAKKNFYSRSAVDSFVMTAKRNPRLFWRHLPSSRSTPQLPSAGDPSECTRLFSGLFNKHAADEAPALPPGEHHDEPDVVLNEHVTKDDLCVVLRALRPACSSGADGAPADTLQCRSYGGHAAAAKTASM